MNLSSAFKPEREKNEVLARIRQVMKQASKGDLEQRVVGVPDDDPYHDLAVDLNNLLDIVDAYVRESRASLEYVTEGKYFRRVVRRGLLGSFGYAADAINNATTAMHEKVAGFHKLTKRFKVNVMDVSHSLSDSAKELETSAGGVNMVMKDARVGAGVIMKNADATSENVVGISSATGKLTDAIGEVQEQIRDSAQISRVAVERSAKTQDAMSDLEEASRKIGSVIQVIQRVAEQTNLLSLNAMIEAVRVGEAGRGFAVVAQEVKALSQQTSDATGEVAEQIQAIQSLTHSAVSAIESVRETITEMAEVTGYVATSMEVQANATCDISSNIGQAAQATQDVSGQVHEVTDAIGKADVSAEAMLKASRIVLKQTDTLQMEMEEYLDAAAKAV